jgi:hypothetical protein
MLIGTNWRVAQLGLWLVLGPVVGLFQGAVSFVPVVGVHPPRAQDWHDIALLSIGGLFWGLCWLTPALVLVDLVFLRRSLLARDLVRFVAIVGGVAAIMGILTPGYLVMIGVPVTAFGILVVGFLHRRSSDPIVAP